MATINKYNKQTWVNNSTKISAENLDKVETGLETLSEQTQQYVSEWADEWSTFKSTELNQISSDIYNNSVNIENAFSALSSHYIRLEDLDTAVAGVNTPVQTVSASINAKALKWTEANQTTYLDSIPKDDHLVRLDVTLSGSAADGYTDYVNALQKKKRIPLCSIATAVGSSPTSIGTGPGNVSCCYGTGLWSLLLEEHPEASWENLTSDEEESLLGDPILALNDELNFAVGPQINSSDACDVFSTQNYDASIDYVLIFYSTKNNKYYFANLNNLSIGYDLRYCVATIPAPDTGVSQSYLCIDQHHANQEIFQLPTNDLKLVHIAFMTKTTHLEEIDVLPYDYFNYLGDLYTGSKLHHYLFRCKGNGGIFTDSYPILSTGTYYLRTMGQSQDSKDFWYKIGSSVNGPYSSTDSDMPDLNWLQYFSNAVITYKFTCPTGTSNAYKVLELCQKHTDDDIKQIAKNMLNDLISFGSDDPTTSTNGMFYFKINSTD